MGAEGGGEDACGWVGVDVVRCLGVGVGGVGFVWVLGAGRCADAVLGRGGGGGRVP